MAAVAAIACIALGACAGTASERFYVLAPAAADPLGTDTAPARDMTLVIAAIPGSVDRPQLVRRVGSNELEVLEFDRWGEPLREGIASTLRGDLRRRLAVPAAGDGPLALTVRIDAMSAAIDGNVVLEASWTAQRSSTAGAGEPGKPVSGRIATHRDAPGASPRAITAAWSSELDEVAQAISASLSASVAAPLAGTRAP
jgi:uncharacterized lipoprotein YmbA